MTRRLPTKQLLSVGARGIHVLKYLEKLVHPRWPRTFLRSSRILTPDRWIGSEHRSED
jgi:hypothetical protein